MPELPDFQLGVNLEQYIRDAAVELSRRMGESLRHYEPQPTQEAFHRSLASERILRGGNRSGKSMAAFVETARAALGKDPYGKYPTDRPLLIWLILYNENYIGRTAYRMLFQAGAFRMIRDLETGLLRAYRPWDPADKAREKETKPAPPLIPERFAPDEAFTWRVRRDRIFTSVTLQLGDDHPMNGTVIRAFSSDAKPPMSDPVDVIHIDEDLQNGTWYLSELEARLSDNKGRLFWSVFPHSSNDALKRLSKQAEHQKGAEKPDVEEFLLTFTANPHIDSDEKRKRLAVWSPEERRARDEGDFLEDLVLCYPEYSDRVHWVPRLRDDPSFGKLDELLASGMIPRDWTKYLWIDPGHGTTAGLFLAVPPPKVGDYVVAYDELYIHQCSAEIFGRALQKKGFGQWFRAFGMDEHMGRQTQVGGKTVKQQFSDVLKKLKVSAELTGYGFIPGSDDVTGRMMAVHGWLGPREDGSIKFHVLGGRCPNLCKEFTLYKKRVVSETAREQPVDKNNHLMNCLEYAAHYPMLRYYPPARPDEDVPKIVQEFREGTKVEERRKQRSQSDCVFLGAGR